MRTPVIASGILLLVLLLPAPQAGAQSVEFTGSWAVRNHEYTGGATSVPGEYAGLPVNDEARVRGDAWQATLQEMPERQCIPYTTSFLTTGNPASVQMWADTDPLSGRVVAWQMRWYFGTRTIWMDGRPHPSPVARHTAMGFSTGRMIGDVLHIRTTHLTEGMLWQSGVPSSNQATISEYIARQGDMLSMTMILSDPIYLEEPLIRSKTHVLDATLTVRPATCEPAVESLRAMDEVPHYLPGTNPYLSEMAEKFGIPVDAVRGGAATMYPEYRKKLKAQSTPPATARSR